MRKQFLNFWAGTSTGKSKRRAGWIEHNYLAGLLLIIIVLSIFMLFFAKYRNATPGEDAECDEYIRVHMLAKNSIIDPKFDDFPCKTKGVTVNSNSEYEVMNQVSKAMATCYNRFKQGNVNLFSAEKPNVKEVFCSACNIINFTGKQARIDYFRLFTFQTVAGMGNEKYMDILESKQYTWEFANYLSLYGKDKSLRHSNGLDGIAIDTSQKYLTVFRYEKTEVTNLENGIQEYMTKVGGGAGAGAAVGAVGVGALVYVGVLSGPGALIIIPTALVVGGISGAVLGYESIRTSDENDRTIFKGKLLLVPFTSEGLAATGCETIMGIQEPGITSRGAGDNAKTLP